MPLLGAHMSIAGGYYKAVEAARAAGCEVVQLFTKNNNQWRGKPLTDDDAARFQAALAEHGIVHPLSHDCYLINLATPDESLWQRSIDAFTDELQRAERLGIPYVVTHPGAHTTASEADGLARVAAALDEVHRRTRGIRAACLLENTAGQGTSLGWRLEHLRAILDSVREPERLGVCIDTCHLLAAGYPLSGEREYRSTIRALDENVGLERIRAFHLNDSRRELGSRVDRHAHIGRGHVGLDGFRRLLNDRRFRRVPMYLETPKEQEHGEEMDVVNLRVLRGLVGAKAVPDAEGNGRISKSEKRNPKRANGKNSKSERRNLKRAGSTRS
jgi:deoxyribonuclease-4